MDWGPKLCLLVTPSIDTQVWLSVTTWFSCLSCSPYTAQRTVPSDKICCSYSSFKKLSRAKNRWVALPWKERMHIKRLRSVQLQFSQTRCCFVACKPDKSASSCFYLLWEMHLAPPAVHTDFPPTWFVRGQSSVYLIWGWFETLRLYTVYGLIRRSVSQLGLSMSSRVQLY